MRVSHHVVQNVIGYQKVFSSAVLESFKGLEGGTNRDEKLNELLYLLNVKK